MLVKVRLFAMLREAAGSKVLDLELEGTPSVEDALAALKAMPMLAEPLARIPLAVAVNREYVDRSYLLSAGDELALVPPVSGGSGLSAPRVSTAIVQTPLSIERAVGFVSSPRAGAVVTFQGNTRDVPELNYESYVEMAAVQLERIAQRIADELPIEAISIEHRLGTVPLGETSVVIAVSAAHREEAFTAARAAIDQIKVSVPIWKKEIEEDGSSSWVAGTTVRSPNE